MSATTHWPQDRLEQFWALQARARKADLHLTAAADGGFRLRSSITDKGKTFGDLDGAEIAVAAAEKSRSSR